ncbi:MAG: hypothetical protein Q7S87_18855, partial [Agitococcus sp.]|nr:hypothetical protein [Agitococcus sp.]
IASKALDDAHHLSAMEVTKLEASVREVSSLVSGYDAKLQSTVNFVYTGVTTLSNTTKVLGEYIGNKNPDPIYLANALLLQTMNPVEQAKALADGLLLGGPRAQLDKMKTDIDSVFAPHQAATVLQTYTTVSQGLAIAQSTVALASKLGIRVPADIQKGIKTGMEIMSAANTVMDIASGFAVGGPIGGAMALLGAGGIMGGGAAGGGPDPTTIAMLGKIQQTLNQVLELQKQTLEKLDELDQKMYAQHLTEMGELKKINAKLDSIIDKAIADTNSEWQPCMTFVENVKTAANTLPATSTFYEYYASLHNENNPYFDPFVGCRTQLQSKLKLIESAVPKLLTFRAENDNTTGTANLASSMHTLVYRPAWDLTKELLSHNNNKACSDNLAPTLATMALTLAPSTKNGCTTSAVPNTSWKLPSRYQADSKLALADYVAHDATWNQGNVLGVLLSFEVQIAPFLELVQSTTDANLRLGNDLKKPRGNQIAARDNFANFLDVTSVAAAQESILAGVAITAQLMTKVLAARDNNDLGLEGPAKAPTTDAFYETCTLPAGAPPAMYTARLNCVLERNPFMLANALTWWIAEKTKQDTASLYKYNQKYFLLDAMNQQVPEMKANYDAEGVYGFVLVADTENVKLAPGQPVGGWYFKFKGLKNGGKSMVYVPLPSAYEVSNKIAKYRPQAEGLRQIVVQALAQFERYSLHLDNASVSLDTRVIANLAAGSAALVANAQAARKP